MGGEITPLLRAELNLRWGMFRLAKFLIAFLTLALSAAQAAYGQLYDPRTEVFREYEMRRMGMDVAPPASNPELEEALVLAIKTAKAIAVFPRVSALLQKKREAEVFAPAVCLPPPEGLTREAWNLRPGVRPIRENWDWPRTTMTHDGEKYVVGSPEFEAITTKVAPKSNLPISCDGRQCEVIIPAAIYRHSEAIRDKVLSEAGFVFEPRIYQDAAQCMNDWCAPDFVCWGPDRYMAFYRGSDRTRLEVSVIPLGRAKASLKLRFLPDSEPFCESFREIAAEPDRFIGSPLCKERPK